MVTITETRSGDVLNEAALKMITGDDNITARAPYSRGAVSYRPKFTPIIMTNTPPQIRDTDNAIWRRLLVLKFPVIFAESEQDPDLRVKLTQPDILPGVFNWVLEGLDMYRKNNSRLYISPNMQHSLIGYKNDNDKMLEFMEDCVVVDPAACTPLENFRAAYNSYQTIVQHEPRYHLSSKAITKILENKQLVTRRKNRTGWLYYGLRLMSSDESPVNLTVLPSDSGKMSGIGMQPDDGKLIAMFPSADTAITAPTHHDNNEQFRVSRRKLKSA